jgi:hypothetical protein
MSILEKNGMQIADKAAYAGNQQAAENNDSKEVIFTTEASTALLE